MKETKGKLNEITILSPGKGCWKTRKIIRFLEKFTKENHINAEINTIFEMKKLLHYRTWILPTIIINGKTIARGYRPSEKKLFDALK